MKGITFLIPYLNEDVEVTTKNLKICINTLTALKVKGEIIVMDGGSDIKKILKINSFNKSPDKKFVNFKHILDYPLIFPNKNIGIMNASRIAKYDNVLIIDSDFADLSKEKIERLAKPLMENLCSAVFANLQRKGGRSNRLLGNPPMRFFFPKIYKKIPYPYPGFIGIKGNLLNKITKDYCFDWGGETQIAINSYLYSNGNVISVPIKKTDFKKRKLFLMIRDAYQIYRASLLLSIQKGAFPKTFKDVDLMFKKDLIFSKKESNSMKQFVNRKTKGLIGSNTFSFYLSLSKICEDDPASILKQMEESAKENSFYELYVATSLVVRPLLSILFNIGVEGNTKEINPRNIPSLKMKKISFLGDIFLAALLRAYLLKYPNKKPYKNMDEMLVNSLKRLTEFNHFASISLAHNYSNGLDITSIGKYDLSRISTATKIKNIGIRNETISKIYNDAVIGYVGDKTFNFKDLKFSEEGIDLDKDAFFKLSLLSTLAGYLKEDNVGVNSVYNDNSHLAKFISYVLNNKKFAPRTYSLNLDFYGGGIRKISKKHDYDCIILFSGGIDSTAAVLKALDEGLNPFLLWVGFGQKNEKQEFKRAKKIANKLKIPLANVRLDIKTYIDKGWKEWDYIVPARNFMFVSFAANYLRKSKKNNLKIYLSAHQEEIKHSNTDKSKYFFKKCSKLFSDYYNKNIAVKSPFEDYSKVEIISYWDKYWKNKYNISPYETTTCYYGNNCGECNACLKRTMAFLAANLKMDLDIKKNPMKDEKKFISERILSRLNSFSEKRKFETIIAIKNSLDAVPQNLKDFYNRLNKNIIKKTLKQEEKIKNIKLK